MLQQAPDMQRCGCCKGSMGGRETVAEPAIYQELSSGFESV